MARQERPQLIIVGASAYSRALDFARFRAIADEVGAFLMADIANAQALCGRLAEGGLSVVSGGTDCHLGVIDLRPWGLVGNVAEQALEAIGITVNKNIVPGDEVKPSVTSGIRIGSAACTSRGMGVDEFREIGDMILAMLGGVRSGALDSRTERSIREGIGELTKRFKLPY
ncbi:MULTISPECIES: hypothetical protein [unclassified Pseudomonas]|jgi:glycine hydroxymethyltransferase|uniref:hypothetical protein n=1 Tax=unclassified Pseudomonas TaxID=196821 RepID=UPI00182111A0|nr:MULTISPECIES: hypothetical protein [unclassified Pseudomonas]MBB6286275.1 glycine/serine hydroxymethyltransferase [Pseudomonas sp. SJZ073]MBB6311800.1 glycine/serine hydroxymethyltransferase [Pseudomonas sp. JAI120]